MTANEIKIRRMDIHLPPDFSHRARGILRQLDPALNRMLAGREPKLYQAMDIPSITLPALTVRPKDSDTQIARAIARALGRTLNQTLSRTVPPGADGPPEESR